MNTADPLRAVRVRPTNQGHSGEEGAKQEFHWLDLLKWMAAVPIAASIFAFAFDIGYFYSIDISWFGFFSLQEHTAFALRALPLALSALIMMAIVLNPESVRNLLDFRLKRLVKEVKERAAAHGINLDRVVNDAVSVCWVLILTALVIQLVVVLVDPTSIVEKLIRAIGVLGSWVGVAVTLGVSYNVFPKTSFRLLKLLWIATLLTAATYVIWIEGYVGLGISIISLVCGTITYFTHSNRLRVEIRFAYLCMVITISTFFLGFLTAKSWYVEIVRPSSSEIVFTLGPPASGRVMHPGQQGLLFYQRKSEYGGGIKFFRWDGIEQIRSNLRN
jgi:hypothetical protein